MWTTLKRPCDRTYLHGHPEDVSYRPVLGDPPVDHAIDANVLDGKTVAC